jgi:hypothetical protein
MHHVSNCLFCKTILVARLFLSAKGCNNAKQAVLLLLLLLKTFRCLQLCLPVQTSAACP